MSEKDFFTLVTFNLLVLRDSIRKKYPGKLITIEIAPVYSIKGRPSTSSTVLVILHFTNDFVFKRSDMATWAKCLNADACYEFEKNQVILRCNNTYVTK